MRREKKIHLIDGFKTYLGTFNYKNPKTIYTSINFWIDIDNEDNDYKDSLVKLKRKIGRFVNSFVSNNALLDNNFIHEFSHRETNFIIGSSTFLSLDICLKQKGKLNLDDLRDGIVKDIFNLEKNIEDYCKNVHLTINNKK